jgi:hypothetical protein
LFRDPIFDGAADPTIIWNVEEQAWWLLYTNRRANVPCAGVSWVHGTDIGIASSADGGASWRYRGILRGLEFERGRNTFWAPEIVRSGDLYHMFVSYVPGVPHDWSGPRAIVHMTSSNLWDWRYASTLRLSSDRVIDAGLLQLADGTWRMWYKDEAHHSYTYAAASPDLYHWEVLGPVITDCPHEGPNVFRWHDRYWMITDTWQGLGVYHADDAQHWTRGPDMLGTPGQRPDDGQIGAHADVLVQGERAFIFYFTHPDWDRTDQYGMQDVHPYHVKRTALQVAELGLAGETLVCDRDRPFDFTLQPGGGRG